MFDILRVNHIGVAFTKRQIINGIKHVGFSHAIITNQAINFIRKLQRSFFNIFIIDDIEAM
jgi:hypothetical protein